MIFLSFLYLNNIVSYATMRQNTSPHPHPPPSSNVGNGRDRSAMPLHAA